MLLLASRFVLCALVIMGAIAPSLCLAQTTYSVTKAANFRQTSASGVVPDTRPFTFTFFRTPTANTQILLRIPSGTTYAIQANSVGGFFTYATAADLETNFPAGTYTFTVGTSGIPITFPATPLPADIPRIVGGTWNSAGQLVVNPAKDYTMTISPFTSYGTTGIGTTLEVGSISLFQESYFSTDFPAVVTNITIPARTLPAGSVRPFFVNFEILHSQNTTAVPGNVAIARSRTALSFDIAAVAPANATPAIIAQPTSQTITSGSTVVFSIEDEAPSASIYQWRRGTTNIAGETRPTLVLSGSAASAGNYSCVVTNSAGSATSANAVLAVNSVAAVDVGRLINLSVLAPTGPAERLLTMGATVGGTGASGVLPLVVRGVGPTLGTFGVAGVLADPVLSIFPAGGSTPSATNDNWGGTAALVAAFADVGAFALPATSLDSAVLQSQAAGGFTVQVAGKGSASGTVIAEVYDASGAGRISTTPRLTNLSTLTSIAPASSLSAGFVIRGATARTVLVRAVGPTLGTAFGISGAMADPRLELFNNDTGVKIGENDNWAGTPWLVGTHTAVGAFALGGAATKDASLVVTLAPGAYSARVSGLNGRGGTAIIEVYEVP